MTNAENLGLRNQGKMALSYM